MFARLFALNGDVGVLSWLKLKGAPSMQSRRVQGKGFPRRAQKGRDPGFPRLATELCSPRESSGGWGVGVPVSRVRGLGHWTSVVSAQGLARQ